MEGCPDKHYGRGWCHRHYQRWRKWGDPDTVVQSHPQPAVCVVDGCASTPHARGLCPTHYRRSRLYGDPLAVAPPRERSRPQPCSINGCGGPVRARGWCVKHYTRAVRHGDPMYDERNPNRPGGLRRCYRCREELPILCYYPHPSTGLSRACRTCTRAVRLRWRNENVERERAASRAYLRQNLHRYRQYNMQRRARIAGASQVEPFTAEEVFERDEWCCGLCDDPIEPERSWPDPMSPSVDHVVPLSKGGHHTLANVQAAHLVCNMRKGAQVASSASGRSSS